MDKVVIAYEPVSQTGDGTANHDSSIAIPAAVSQYRRRYYNTNSDKANTDSDIANTDGDITNTNSAVTYIDSNVLPQWVVGVSLCGSLF